MEKDKSNNNEFQKNEMDGHFEEEPERIMVDPDNLSGVEYPKEEKSKVPSYDEIYGEDNISVGGEENKTQEEPENDYVSSNDGFIEAETEVETKNVEYERGFLSNFIRKKKEEVFDPNKDRMLATEISKNIPPALIDRDGDGKDDVIYKDAEIIDNPEIKSDMNFRDRERRSLSLKRKLITYGVLALVFLLLFWLAPDIQKALFATKDNSLVFKSQTGFFGPRLGILEMAIGLVGIYLLISGFIKRLKEKRINKNLLPTTRDVIVKRLGIAMLILLPIGFTNLYNFSEFRNSDIRFSSFINGSDVRDYSAVNSQKVFLEGKDIVYELGLKGKTTSFAINSVPVETVKLLDSKLNPNRQIVIDNVTFQEIIKNNIYTEKEAYDVYKYKVQQ